MNRANRCVTTRSAQKAHISPLNGVRVLDFTSAWAGPFATRSLAYLGAEVIKVENPDRLDPWRGWVIGGDTSRFPGENPGARPYNRNVLFNTQNQGKRAIAVDIKHPSGRDLVLDMARVSDIAVANFPHGTLDKLGIGWRDLSAANERISLIEMPAFRANSRSADHVAMGKSMEAASGMASLLPAHEDGSPMLTGPAYLDPVGGLHGTVGALTAYYSYVRSGSGSYVEVGQTEAATLWIGEYILQCLHGGSASPREGNNVDDCFPHDAFPCEGMDEWVAIAVQSDAQWRELAGIIGGTALADNPAYATPDLRRLNGEAITRLISGWTYTMDKSAAARTLQELGVPAAPVNTGRDVANDPWLNASGFVSRLAHPEAGVHRYPGMGYGFSESSTKAAPCFAEDTNYVLQNVLGYSQDKVSRLVAARVVRLEPTLDGEYSPSANPRSQSLPLAHAQFCGSAAPGTCPTGERRLSVSLIAASGGSPVIFEHGTCRRKCYVCY